MNIQELIAKGLSEGINVLLVAPGDLLEFGQTLIKQTRQELARELAAKNNEVYYSVDQVVSILNVSKMTLWRWAQPEKNYLIPIRVGGLTRYRKSDIDRIVGSEK